MSDFKEPTWRPNYKIKDLAPDTHRILSVILMTYAKKLQERISAELQNPEEITEFMGFSPDDMYNTLLTGKSSGIEGTMQAMETLIEKGLLKIEMNPKRKSISLMVWNGYEYKPF